MRNNIYSKFLDSENNTHKQNKNKKKTFKKVLKENISEEAEKKLNDYKKKLEDKGYKVKSSKVEKGGSVYGSPKYNLYLDFVLDKDITKEEFAKIVDMYKSGVKIYDEEDNEVESGKEVRIRYRENIEEKSSIRKKNKKPISEEKYHTYYDYDGLPENLGLSIEKITDILEKYDIKYRYYIEVDEDFDFDGEKEIAYYDYVSKFDFEEEVSEDIMSKIEKEIKKELKYSEVYPDDNMLGIIVTLGSGDEDDLFESKKSKMNEDVYDVEHLVFYPDDLTDDEVYSRNILLGSLADISDFLSEEIGDAYIVSMSEKPKDKEDPYMSDCVITLTFEGDDVNKNSLEKIREFLGSETPFEDFEIIGDNKISFLFQPKYQ